MLVLVAVAVTFLAFYPSLDNGFVDWDDPKYLLENPVVWELTKDNVKEMFKPTSFTHSYVPLSQLSFALENHFSDHAYNSPENAKMHHRNNLLLHLLNTILVFFLVYRLCKRKVAPAFIVALFFGIHPMHVESVAWISERKDVLFSAFFIASLYLYSIYKLDGKYWAYLLAIVFAFASVASKSAGAPIGAAILLVAFWLNGKPKMKDWLESIPFFAAGAWVGYMTVYVGNKTGTIAAGSVLSFVDRCAVAGHNVLMYIVKFFVPYELTNYYPYPELSEPLPVMYYVAPFLALALVGLMIWSLKKTRIFFFGGMFFLVNVALVLQFFPVGPNIMAERYTYIPYIGFLFIVAAGYQYLVDNNKKQPLLLFNVVLALGAASFVYITMDRCKVWKSSETLWTDVIGKYGNEIDVAFLNRGNYYAKEMGELDKGIADYMVLVNKGTADVKVFTNLGNSLGLKGRQFAEAGRMDLANDHYNRSVEAFTNAINLDSLQVRAYVNRGITYGFVGRHEEALVDFNKALKIDPNEMDARVERAFLYFSMKDYQTAVGEYTYLINTFPPISAYYQNRGISYFYLNDFNSALKDFAILIGMEPNNGEHYFNSSVCFSRVGDMQQALSYGEKAAQLGYKVQPSYLNELRQKLGGS